MALPFVFVPFGTLSRHPDDDRRDAESVIFEALREAYGCKD